MTTLGVGTENEERNAGALPGPVIGGGQERWDVEALQKALRSEALYEPEPGPW